MRRRNALVFFMFLLPLYTIASESKQVSFYIEFTQMLTLNAGIELSINDRWGFHSALGTSIPPSGTFTWSLLGFYRLFSPDNLWQLDVEAGVPLAYFNFLEGEYIDAAPYIDTTFHGYLFGLGFSGGLLTKIGFFGLRGGAALWLENRGDSG